MCLEFIQPKGEFMTLKLFSAAAMLALGTTLALAQGEPPRPSDPTAPGALYRGGSGQGSGVERMRRSDEMAPMKQSDVSFRGARAREHERGYSIPGRPVRNYSQ
jgi:hypothetical protein